MEESENPGIGGREESGNGKWGIPESGVKKLAAQDPVTDWSHTQLSTQEIWFHILGSVATPARQFGHAMQIFLCL